MNKMMKLLIMSLATVLSVLGFSQTVEASDIDFSVFEKSDYVNETRNGDYPRYAVLEGTHYYKSICDYGSSNCYTISRDQAWTSSFKVNYVAIDGYAAIDLDGNILSHTFKKGADWYHMMPCWEIGTKEGFYHIRIGSKEIGWINASEIIILSYGNQFDEGISTKEVAIQIAEGLINADESTALLIDSAVLWSSNKLEVLDWLTEINFSTKGALFNKARIFKYSNNLVEMHNDNFVLQELISDKHECIFPKLYTSVENAYQDYGITNFIVLTDFSAEDRDVKLSGEFDGTFTLYDVDDFMWYESDFTEKFPNLNFERIQVAKY